MRWSIVCWALRRRFDVALCLCACVLAMPVVQDAAHFARPETPMPRPTVHRGRRRTADEGSSPSECLLCVTSNNRPPNSVFPFLPFPPSISLSLHAYLPPSSYTPHDLGGESRCITFVSSLATTTRIHRIFATLETNVIALHVLCVVDSEARRHRAIFFPVALVSGAAARYVPRHRHAAARRLVGPLQRVLSSNNEHSATAFGRGNYG